MCMCVRVRVRVRVYFDRIRSQKWAFGCVFLDFFNVSPRTGTGVDACIRIHFVVTLFVLFSEPV